MKKPVFTPIMAKKRHIFAIIQQGNPKQAIKTLEQMLKISPNDPDLHYLLGLAHMNLGNLKQASANFNRAIKIQTTYVDAWVQLGQLLQAVGDISGAISLYRTGISILPDVVHLHLSLGTLLQGQGKPGEAIKCYQDALLIHPESSELYYNLGTAEIARGGLFTAVQQFRHALRLTPGSAVAHHNLAGTLMHLGELDEAELHFHEAIRFDPSLTDARVGLVSILLKLGQPGEALKQCREVLSHYPDNHSAQECYLMCLNYVPGKSNTCIISEHNKWGKEFSRRYDDKQKPHRDMTPDRPIRVGYVSPDFTDHPVGYFMMAALTFHNKNQVETYCYSNAQATDSYTESLKSLQNNWRNTAFLTDEQLIAQILKDRIDILVDLAGHTDGNRLSVFARKPAPLQITYLGYPNTTGLPEMDYRVTDIIADPDEGNYLYAEKLLFMESGFSCFIPSENAPDVNALPAEKNGFLTFGSLNNASRLTNEVVNLWCQLLQTVPESRLLIYRNTLKGKLRHRLSALFNKHGIETDRITITDKAPIPTNHLSMYHHFDIALDTFPWSGHTTACQAIWMGIPVITLRGDTFAGRMVTSLYHQLGLTEFIATNKDEYINIGNKLASDINSLSNYRRELRDIMKGSPLCNGQLFARNLEKLYRHAWQELCTSNRPITSI